LGSVMLEQGKIRIVKHVAVHGVRPCMG